MSRPLLSVEDLCVDFPLGRGHVRRAVDGVSLSIAAGRTVGLVGESGSGKSTIARAIVGLAPLTAGRVELADSGTSSDEPGPRAQMIFQDPYSSLDPTKTIAYSVSEPLRAQRHDLGRAEISRRTDEMLESVGVPAARGGMYPAHFSGGQRQRIAIARALICEPRLVICDEALSALDLSVQAQIIRLLVRLRESRGVSYLFISHDLSVVEMLCDEVVVLYRGRVVERGPAHELRSTPRHPYTRGLVAAVPQIDPEARQASLRRRERLRHPVLRPAALGDSCHYAHRCVFATDECERRRPPLREIDGHAAVACHRAEEVARELDADPALARAGTAPATSSIPRSPEE